MNATINHPAITDLTTPTVDFLDWVQGQGYRIEIATEGPWFKATLIGRKRVVSGYGEETVMEFCGHGKTREGAVLELMHSCSGCRHYPLMSKNFFITRSGPEAQFPSFHMTP